MGNICGGLPKVCPSKSMLIRVGRVALFQVVVVVGGTDSDPARFPNQAEVVLARGHVHKLIRAVVAFK